MPSTSKTPHLGLNKWVGTDKPKMSDFNTDNQKVDDAVKAHVENSVAHLSAAEHQWLAAPMLVGSYTGTGTYTREISLGFAPKLVLVFGGGVPMAEYNYADSYTGQTIAVCTQRAASMGVELINEGFRVYNSNSVALDGMSVARMNITDVVYSYVAWK